MPGKSRNRRMRGGFWDWFSSSGWNTPRSSSMWGTPAYTGYPSTSYPSTSYPSTSYPSSSYPSSSYPSSSYPSSSYPSSSYPSSSYPSSRPSMSNYASPTRRSFGGKKNKSKRYMRGGFSGVKPGIGLADNAASFSGPTAEPKTIVGGRTRRRRRTRHRR
jgi:hypothetical protein